VGEQIYFLPQKTQKTQNAELKSAGARNFSFYFFRVFGD
jgi:hypothetical protein